MLTKFYKLIDPNIEICFYILHSNENISNESVIESLYNILGATSKTPTINGIEIGPKPHMVTPWCTNVLSILQKCEQYSNIERIEYSIISKNGASHFDRMTHEIYNDQTFEKVQNVNEKDYFYIEDILKFSDDNNLGFDKEDLRFYKSYFHNLQRLPTNIELFDLGQSNSEHSRHWFFNGILNIDGFEQEKSLMRMVKDTLSPNTNSLIAFSDNSSAIRGNRILFLYPYQGKYQISDKIFHPTLTAETHNFPTSISPFPGANTGTGGRIRDVQAIGTGGIPISGSAGYCVGDIIIDSNEVFGYPDNLAKPRNILIEASNGASDYGNKFGEPIIHGFCRSFRMIVNGERREWIKPIMFTSGTGLVYDKHLYKKQLEKDDLVVKIGGPAYRIGLGGGSCSSSDKSSKLDFNAVQRGDPEMENKMNRVVRQCIEMFDENPIKSIHDQGAGGNANILKELIYPEGGIMNIEKFTLGDKTMTPLELWCSEYQEQNGLIINEKDRLRLQNIAKRENVPIDFVGKIDNSRKIKLVKNSEIIVNLNLPPLFENKIQKTFYLKSNNKVLKPLIYDNDIDKNLDKVLGLLSVGSKAFLTNKVDRSVTGLIAQQQCVGPYHLPLSNVAVTAHSYFDTIGTATAIGEQPIKALVDIKNMVRLSIAEMLTNIMWAKISSFKDIKCSGNWMWSARYEGVELHEAVQELSRCLQELGISIDGGKDSLSMSTEFQNSFNKKEIVKCPPSLVLTGYALCDITKTITPDFKKKDSYIVYVPITQNSLPEYFLGGSAFAQVNNQLGMTCPTVEMKNLKNVFNIIQSLNSNILSGHDVSDGGLITTLVEMAISGGIGVELAISELGENPISILFSENPGVVIEIDSLSDLLKDEEYFDANFYILGKTCNHKKFIIENVMERDLLDLRRQWTKISFEMEKLQSNPKTAKEEFDNMNFEKPKYMFNKNINLPISRSNFKVVILREEGSNSDKEMAAAFYMAGFEVYDVCMNDLFEDKLSLKDFHGLAFVGGFTFSDVLGAGKGWTEIIERRLKKEFDDFYNRADTFSLGICNGCQVMARLGWVKGNFIENDSQRFESRFSTVKILKSNCIFLKDLENCVLPIWVAHREGKYIPHNKFHSSQDKYSNNKSSKECIRYVDTNNNITEKYPYNPNGSINGVAGICSKNGRHLAMMPHPERSFLKWQLAYSQNSISQNIKSQDIPEGMSLSNATSPNTSSPWYYMFVNALKWLNKN